VDLVANTWWAQIALKALVSGVIVFFVLRGVDKLGDRASGMVSGLPYSSAPALLWLAADSNLVVMTSIATDAMVTASTYAAFPVFFLAFAHFLRGWMLLPLAAVSSVALVYLTHALFAFAAPTTSALLVCGAWLWGARLMLPQTRPHVEAAMPSLAEIRKMASSKLATLSITQRHAMTAAIASLLVLFLMLLGQSSPRWMAAALVGLPVISATVLSNALVSGSHSKTLRTAEGFIDGCVIRACFCFFFALLLPELGVAAAFSCAIALALCLAGSLFYRARMLSQSHALESRQALTTMWIGRPR
jgi:hypothetical protein